MSEAKNNSKPLVIALLVILAVIVVVYAIYAYTNKTNQPGQLDEFATCLKDKGAVFYGAFWCTHCQDEKRLFGNSEKLLPYVECSTPDGQSQTKVCVDNNITAYPTWVFADGTRQTGALSLQQLADQTDCQIPQQ